MRARARHLAYAGGWRKLEPLWDLAIRSRHVNAMLPALERTLDAFIGARRRAATGSQRVLAGEPSPRWASVCLGPRAIIEQKGTT